MKNPDKLSCHREVGEIVLEYSWEIVLETRNLENIMSEVSRSLTAGSEQVTAAEP